MSNLEERKNNLNINKIETALIQNNLADLNDVERLRYYFDVCDSLGLNAKTNPFGYILLNGKLCLYAKKDATDQLRKIHNVSIIITSRNHDNGIYCVTARAKLPDGREDESLGSVNIQNLKGDMLANALMKAETKAKRRVTLSICGLGLLDEVEADSISDVKIIEFSKVDNLEKENKENKEKNIKQPEKSIEVKEDNQSKSKKLPNLALEIYAMKGGRYSGLLLKSFEHLELKRYVQQCKAIELESKKPLPPEVQENIWAIEEYLGL